MVGVVFFEMENGERVREYKMYFENEKEMENFMNFMDKASEIEFQYQWKASKK